MPRIHALACGPFFSAAQVTVKEHNDKDDEEGARICGARVQVSRDRRRFQPVTPGMLLRVTVRNLSTSTTLSFVPVYVGKDGEEPEERIELSAGEVSGRAPGWRSGMEGEARGGEGKRIRRCATLLPACARQFPACWLPYECWRHRASAQRKRCRLIV